MNKPGQLTAMISSTALDLPEHRQRVMDACLHEGIFPIGMEHLPARDASGIRVSLEMVDQADIYIGVYAWRYGWVPDFDNPDKISITEMEFSRALERTARGELWQTDKSRHAQGDARENVGLGTTKNLSRYLPPDQHREGTQRQYFRSGESARGVCKN